MNTRFENARTVEQLKQSTGSAKLFFSYAFKKGDDGMNHPIFINGEDGKPTTTQAVAISNEAGTTLAWCSREVASQVAQGINPASDPRGLSVVDIYDADSGAFVGTKLVHPKQNNVIQGITL